MPRLSLCCRVFAAAALASSGCHDDGGATAAPPAAPPLATATATSSGGATLTVPAGSPEAGAALSVPGGAVSGDVDLAIAASGGLDPALAALAVGPAVAFRPGGLALAIPALATLPFDPTLTASIAGGRAAVAVLLRDPATGALALAPAAALSIDTVTGRARFPLSRLADAQAFADVPSLVASLVAPGRPTGALAGSVGTAGGGAPPSGVAVRLEDLGGATVAIAYTDASGAYIFAALAPGLYRIEVAGAGPGGASASTIVQVGAGVAAAAPPLTVVALGAIAGRATLGGQASGNAGIAIIASGLALAATTDDAGDYRLDGVPAGTYAVLAAKQGYALGVANPVVVAGGQTTAAVDFDLARNLGGGGGGGGAIVLPPQITSQPVRTCQEGDLYAYTPAATDPQGAAVAFELAAGPLGMTLTAGTVSWRPPYSAVGNNIVVIQASDALGAFSFQIYTLTVLSAWESYPTTRGIASVAVDGAGTKWLAEEDGRVERLDAGAPVPRLLTPDHGAIFGTVTAVALDGAAGGTVASVSYNGGTASDFRFVAGSAYSGTASIAAWTAQAVYDGASGLTTVTIAAADPDLPPSPLPGGPISLAYVVSPSNLAALVPTPIVSSGARSFTLRGDAGFLQGMRFALASRPLVGGAPGSSTIVAGRFDTGADQGWATDRWARATLAPSGFGLQGFAENIFGSDARSLRAAVAIFGPPPPGPVPLSFTLYPADAFVLTAGTTMPSTWTDGAFDDRPLYVEDAGSGAVVLVGNVTATTGGASPALAGTWSQPVTLGTPGRFLIGEADGSIPFTVSDPAASYATDAWVGPDFAALGPVKGPQGPPGTQGGQSRPIYGEVIGNTAQSLDVVAVPGTPADTIMNLAGAPYELGALEQASYFGASAAANTYLVKVTDAGAAFVPGALVGDIVTFDGAPLDAVGLEAITGHIIAEWRRFAPAMIVANDATSFTFPAAGPLPSIAAGTTYEIFAGIVGARAASPWGAAAVAAGAGAIAPLGAGEQETARGTAAARMVLPPARSSGVASLTARFTGPTFGMIYQTTLAITLTDPAATFPLDGSLMGGRASATLVDRCGNFAGVASGAIVGVTDHSVTFVAPVPTNQSGMGLDTSCLPFLGTSEYALLARRVTLAPGEAALAPDTLGGERVAIGGSVLEIAGNGADWIDLRFPSEEFDTLYRFLYGGFPIDSDAPAFRSRRPLPAFLLTGLDAPARPPLSGGFMGQRFQPRAASASDALGNVFVADRGLAIRSPAGAYAHETVASTATEIARGVFDFTFVDQTGGVLFADSRASYAPGSLVGRALAVDGLAVRIAANDTIPIISTESFQPVTVGTAASIALDAADPEGALVAGAFQMLQILSIAVVLPGGGTAGGGTAGSGSSAGYLPIPYRILDTTAGLPSDTIFALAPDGAGGVYLGTDRGLVHRTAAGGYERIAATLARSDGAAATADLSRDPVAALALSGGALYVGTASNGLVALDLGAGAGVQYTVASTESAVGRADGLGSDLVTAIAVDAAGIAWIGGQSGGGPNKKIGGLTRFDPASGSFSHLVSSFDGGVFTGAGNSGLIDNEVYSVAVDAQGDKWIGTATGLARYKGE